MRNDGEKALKGGMRVVNYGNRSRSSVVVVVVVVVIAELMYKVNTRQD